MIFGSAVLVGHTRTPSRTDFQLSQSSAVPILELTASGLLAPVVGAPSMDSMGKAVVTHSTPLLHHAFNVV